ncbi:peptide/nickel transport system permease protein [Pseudomonas sp. URIL14HWK12:I8]|uniref:nickel transporter permease n=1 Tax=unclassified Pseudomonas TaxID=196821 RepID=UPI0004165117|nr:MULTISPECIES: nickel transporter permease [unclassified Pseudomonas]SNB62883.1 peptide/nickel transport system permease protein [Pseudomonas sp. URIL14HWK12:I8]
MNMPVSPQLQELQPAADHGTAHARWRWVFDQPLMAMGVLILLALLVAACAGQWAPHDPYVQALSERLQPPSAAHWFGTDQLGRDIFSRVLHGARYTLLIVLMAAVSVAPVGMAVGLCAGYFGGALETVLMRITDIFMAFPRLLLALALAAALGPGLENAVLAIAVSAWPPYARQARAEAKRLREREFIWASRLAGASHFRILLRHLLPLCASSALVRLTLDLAGMILIAAGLGFLGLGAQPPTPEWGAMVAAGRQILAPYWWVATLPGLAIFLVSLALNLVGDGLRDALDPRAGR